MMSRSPIHYNKSESYAKSLCPKSTTGCIKKLEFGRFFHGFSTRNFFFKNPKHFFKS